MRCYYKLNIFFQSYSELWDVFSFSPFIPMFVYVTHILQTWPLNLLAALMEEIVISQLTFNNIWEQEVHLLSLFVLPD